MFSGFSGHLSIPATTRLASKPHAGWLQFESHTICSHTPLPLEVIWSSADDIHTAFDAVIVPESTSSRYCTVITGQHVVVSVRSGEHHPITVRQCISRVTWEPRNMHLVVGGLIVYYEPTVLSIVPAPIVACLQVKSQLVGTTSCVLMQQFITKPVVAHRVVESNFKLHPRFVEEVGSVEVLLDQQRNTAGYTSQITTSNNRLGGSPSQL